MNLTNLLEHLAKGFYTEFLMQIGALLAILAYFIKKNKTKDLRYLVVLAIASLAESLVSDYDFLTLEKSVNRTAGGLILLTYLLIEMICCLLFIRTHLLSRLARKIILLSPVLLISYPIIRMAYNHSSPSHKATSFFSLLDIEGLIIIVCCLYFFYELFLIKYDKNRHEEYSIWAISGILVLFSAIAPLVLFAKYFFYDDRSIMERLWVINNSAYTLMFIAFAIAIVRNKKRHNIRGGYSL